MTNMQNLSRPQPKAGLLDIAAYVPGKEHVEGVAKVYKLSSNETPIGPSPHAVEAYRHWADHLATYPDGQAIALREAIAESQGLNIGNIICGNGSDELLGLICQTYLAPGDETLITEHGFAVYKIQTMGAGATPVTVKEKTNVSMSMRSLLALLRAPRSFSSPILPTRPALICRLRKCVASMQACQSMFCWCSMLPMPNMCAATTTNPALNWCHRTKTSS